MLCVFLGACDEPTSVRVENATGAPIYRLWWQTTLFSDPIPAGATSADLRTVPGSEPASALLAPGWDETSGVAPTSLLPSQSIDALTVLHGETLVIHVSADTWRGFCDGGQPLTQEEADLLTQRLFPAQFEGQVYLAASCRTEPADAGP
jgi:hypothetical protein